jgi:uncharacterized protein (DUF1697 family)
MPRYAAFLRGVSPMNVKMPQLKAAFEAAGFANVRTLLSSGNVVFDSKASSDGAVERKAEAAMQAHLGRTFYTIARRVDELQKMLDADPYAKFKLAANDKRVVTFLREQPSATLKLPIEFEGARILAMQGREILSAYVPQANNPAFMALIEKTFGKEVTTRTWETVKKCAAA